MTEVRDHFVYRLYDATGALLYIGCTNNPRRRKSEHVGTQPWWPQVATWRLLGPLPRETAYVAESDAIAAEQPRFNDWRERPVEGFGKWPIYVGAREICRALGLSRPRFGQLAGSTDFPEPVMVFAMGKAWHTEDVIQWAKARGREVHE